MIALNPYDERYSRPGLYWGATPSHMADMVLDIARPNPGKPLRLLDIGCGEGRNAIHFARHGFQVTGIDVSVAGLGKMAQWARSIGVSVTPLHANINELTLADRFDVVFSTGTLHYIPPKIRAERFEHLKKNTITSGIHVLTVFVDKPFVATAPDAEKNSYLYRSGELLGYYWDWKILFLQEEIIDCASSGVPHKHAVNRIIAKKIDIS